MIMQRIKMKKTIVGDEMRTNMKKMMNDDEEKKTYQIEVQAVT